LEELIAEYGERQGGFCLQEVAGGYQFRTRPELGSWVKKLKASKPASLTPAALETLAIICLSATHCENGNGKYSRRRRKWTIEGPFGKEAYSHSR